MITTITPHHAEQFRKQGFLFPVNALTAEEAAGYRGELEAHEAKHGKLSGSQRHNAHFLFTWVDRLTRHPVLLDVVEALIGPNILLRGTSFFIKEAHDPGFVSWHQDATYWGLKPLQVVTAWVALSASTAANGAMRVVPGSHREEQIPHVETASPNNMLSRGQEVAVKVDASRAVTMELAPGQMSMHHVLLIHGSEPNPSDHRRIGLAIRYMPTHVKQSGPNPDAVALVRGVDTYHHFPPALRPTSDLAPEALAFHKRCMEGLATQANTFAQARQER